MKPIKEIESQYNWAKRSNKYKQAYFSAMSDLYKIQNIQNIPKSPGLIYNNLRLPCKK